MTQALAFTADLAARLTGLSEGTLRRWDADGFYVPAYADPNRRRPYSRIYSFLDIIALRTISQISKLGVPIQRIKKVGDYLKSLPRASWTSERFYVAGRDVFFRYNDALVAIKPLGQQAMEAIVDIDLRPIVDDTRQQVEKLNERTPDQIGKVVRDRYVMGGQPVFAGTRVPVATIIDFVKRGYDTERIIRNFPRLVPEDIQVAMDEQSNVSKGQRTA